MDYLTRIVYLIMLISSTRGTQTPRDSSSNNSDNSIIPFSNSTNIQTKTLSTTETTLGFRDLPENVPSNTSLSPVIGTTLSSSKGHQYAPTTIPNTHTPKLFNKTNIDGCVNCIVGNKGTHMIIFCAVNGTNKPSMYLGGSKRTLYEKAPGLWNYLLPAHKTAEQHNDTIICNVTDPSTNTTLKDTARFYAKIENRLSLTFTQANGLFTVLCVAKGRPAPKLRIVHHLLNTSYNVTANVTTPPSGDEEAFTSKIEFLVKCTPASVNRLVKCCDRKLCTVETLPPCPGLPQIPHGSTDGVTLDDTSSASITVTITTSLSKNHTGLADSGETKQWLLPVTIVATVVGAFIVVIVIAFLISLKQSRASRHRRPFVNRGLHWGNHAEQVERYEMNANREDGPHDTAVYANANTGVTMAPNTQSPHSASLLRGPDTDCNAPGPDDMHNTSIYFKARPVDWEEGTTVPGEQKDLTYVDIDFSEDQQAPGPSNGWYQPVDYLMVDFTQTKTMKSE